MLLATIIYIIDCLRHRVLNAVNWILCLLDYARNPTEQDVELSMEEKKINCIYTTNLSMLKTTFLRMGESVDITSIKLYCINGNAPPGSVEEIQLKKH